MDSQDYALMLQELHEIESDLKSIAASMELLADSIDPVDGVFCMKGAIST